MGGLTIDLGSTHASLNSAGGYGGLFDSSNNSSNEGFGSLRDIINIGLNMHFLMPSDLLINAGISSAGPYFIVNLGLGALRTTRNLPNNTLRVGGSLDLRMGYSFFNERALAETDPKYALKDNFVIGLEPSFYLTYNNFMWGISLGAEYLIGGHVTLMGSTKWGFLF